MLRLFGQLLMSAAIVLGTQVAMADTEWRMQIHRGDTVQEVRISAVDSLSFVEREVMVWVPPGNVRLGDEELQPIHDCYVEGFWIDKYEVSNSQFREFMDAGGYSDPEWWSPVGWAFRVGNNLSAPQYWYNPFRNGGGLPGNDDFPVNGVSWWEAQAYATWAGKRLPTEAEWEKAAKGGCEIWGQPDQCDEQDTPTFPWGEEIDGSRANYYQSQDPFESNGYTTYVGFYDGRLYLPTEFQTTDSPSPYGLYDVAGNLYEWTSTRFGPYPYDPDDGREDPPVTWNECCRVLRGGSWNTSDWWTACFQRRGNVGPDYRQDDVGFRCARSE